MQDTLLIFTALLLGYAISIQSKVILMTVRKFAWLTTLLVLASMGYGLGSYENTSAEITATITIAAVFSITILLCNTIVFLPYIHSQRDLQHLPTIRLPMSVLGLMKGSFIFVLVVISGFFFGYISGIKIDAALVTSSFLYLLLFLIGLDLRASKIPIHQIISNKIGIRIALFISISALVGGAIAGLIVGVPFSSSLALASGFGWASLSALLVTEHIGPIYGSAAFFIDLTRELVAIAIAPFLMRGYQQVVIGYCGATAMDATLPVIEQTGGIGCVPIAITSGFILTLLTPVLLGGFLSVG